jgi:hypothetical protein
MARPRRLVIVRRGAVDVFQQLQQRFADNADTVVFWDRRVSDRRGGERRFPASESILRERGFLVARPAWTREGREQDDEDRPGGRDSRV